MLGWRVFYLCYFNWLSPFMTLLYAALNIKILKKASLKIYILQKLFIGKTY